jgi:hypothetical protein
VDSAPQRLWSDSEAGWRALADDSAPPTASCPPPAKTRARVATPRPRLATAVQRSRVPTPAPPLIPRFDASERQLWRIAGSLMALAFVVVGVLGLLTFWPEHSAPAAIAAAAATNAPASNTPTAAATGGRSQPAIRPFAKAAERHQKKLVKRTRRKLARK